MSQEKSTGTEGRAPEDFCVGGCWGYLAAGIFSFLLEERSQEQKKVCKPLVMGSQEANRTRNRSLQNPGELLKLERSHQEAVG